MNKEQLNIALKKASQTRTEKDIQEFYRLLYEESFGLVFAIAKNRFPSDAEDIVQGFFCEKFLKLSLEKYHEILEYLPQYLIMSIKNYCSTQIKRQSRKQTCELAVEEQDFQASAEKNIYHPMKNVALSIDISLALDRIPSRQKQAFILHYYEGYKYREISKKMGENISVGAVRQLIHRAKENLKTHLHC